jgi:hypothetical protein
MLHWNDTLIAFFAHFKFVCPLFVYSHIHTTCLLVNLRENLRKKVLIGMKIVANSNIEKEKDGKEGKRE